jgi:hypothetical protein
MSVALLAPSLLGQIGVSTFNTLYCQGAEIPYMGLMMMGGSTDDLDLCFPNATDVEATTGNGTIVGKMGPDGVSRFYGVEYAEATGAPGTATSPRFKYPMPLTPWTTPKQAKQIHHCGGSEDCLRLNIATPATITGGVPDITGLPVFVYFTGGGFYVEGNPAGPIMDMAYHARYGIDVNDPNSPGKAILVYVHYRLGVFGWAAHPGFGPGNGNWGLADGIEGLKWIKANIANFGGNPNMVTIQGSSAGGGYTSLILASPLSVGYINNVISMSPYISYHPAFYSQTAKFEMNMMYMNATGCSSDFVVPAAGSAEATAQADCFMGKSIEEMFGPYGMNYFSMLSAAQLNTGVFTAEVVAAWGAAKGIPGGWYMVGGYNFAANPIVDGYVLDLPPLEAYASGRNKDVTVIMGHQANEYSVVFGAPDSLYGVDFANLDYQIGIKDLPVTASVSDIFYAVYAAYGSSARAASGAYPGFGNVSEWHMNIQTFTDVFFTWGISQATEAMKIGQFTKVYKMLNLMGAPESANTELGTSYPDVYQGSYTTTCATPPCGKVEDFIGNQLGAYHAAEDNGNMGNYLWQTSFMTTPGVQFNEPALSGLNATFSAAEITFATTMNTHWKNVIMGNLPASEAEWPAMSTTSMVYGPQFAAGAAFGPCIRIHASESGGCVTEPTSPFRGTQIAYFESGGTTPMAPATCAVPYLTADGGASAPVTGSFGLTLPKKWPSGDDYMCSPCTCSTSRRQALFGGQPMMGSGCSCA